MENQKKNEYDIQAAKSLGDELGQLRQKSGWDIDEVARRLKLSAEQIEALEKGDYSFFSGLVFVMGYLRSYARLLKIDEATITGRLKAISAPEEDHVYLVDRKQNAGLNYQDGEKVGFPKWVLGMAALILLGGGIYVWQSKSNHENEQQVAQNSDAVRNSMQTPDLKKENVVDLATYEVNFVTYGAEGEGKPEVDIKKVPEVANSNAEISNLLSNPDISFDKQSNLKNGDKVEVTISLNKNTVNKLKLKTTGEFKRTFTVNGLNEKAKEKETIIVKESSSKPSASSSSSSGSRRSDERTVYVRPSAGVNLRSSSNDSSSNITAIPVGRSVYQHYIQVNSEGEAWAYVSYGGSNGWIRADLIG